MTLPTALNDVPGEWTLRVLDLTSGARAEKTIVIGK